MTNKERMTNQKLYDCADPELATEQLYYFELLYDYNHTRPGDTARKKEILDKLLGGMGKDCYIEQPFHANWGKNTYFGDGVYANFNLTLVDDDEIRVGNYVLFGPNVNVTTASHPVEPNLRSRGYQFNIPVEIGNNVWIGAGASILPGVHIGDNSVIGAGSVVTKDIPANVVAVGNPCRILREIGEHDRKYYYKNLEIDIEIEE